MYNKILLLEELRSIINQFMDEQPGPGGVIPFSLTIPNYLWIITVWLIKINFLIIYDEIFVNY